MIVLVWILIVLLLPKSVGLQGQALCTLSGYHHQGYYKEGDRIIGGFLPLTNPPSRQDHTFRNPPHLASRYQSLDFNSYLHLLAFVHAVEEINQSPHLLPNASLGFHIYDTAFSDETALGGVWGLLSGRRTVVPNYDCGGGNKVIAVIEGPTDSHSFGIATMLTPYRYPQLSYGLLDPTLRSKVQFPALYGMVPSEKSLLAGIARLIRHFDWRWVGLIASDDGQGERAVETLAREIRKGGGCVAFTWMLQRYSYTSEKPRRNLGVFQKSSANVTVLYGTKGYLEEFRIVIFWSRIFVKGQVWLLTPQEEFQAQAKYSSVQIFRGSLLFVGHKQEIPGFGRFLRRIKPRHYPEDRYMKAFYQQFYDCSWHDLPWIPRCTGKENHSSSQIFSFTTLSPTWGYSIYNAVYAVAHALHASLSSQLQGNAGSTLSWQLLHFLTSVRFTNPAGEEVFFDNNGDVAAGYDIFNWILSPDKKMSKVPVGAFRPQAPLGHELIINDSVIQWHSSFGQHPPSVCSESCLPGYRKKNRNGEPTCCFDCVACTEGEISTQMTAPGRRQEERAREPPAEGAARREEATQGAARREGAARRRYSPLTDMESCMQCSKDRYPNEKRNECVPKAITFLAYEEPLGLTLASLAVSFSLLTTCILVTFVRHRDTPIVRANNRNLSYVLLLSLLVCFLCSLIFIGRPVRGTCLLRQTAFAVAFAAAVSSVLAKTITVVLAFKGTGMSSRLRTCLKPRTTNSIVLLGTLVQVVLCSVWLGTSPPFPENNTQSKADQIVVQCNEGSVRFFYGALGYLGLLAVISFTVAFLARKLPDAFNEAKHVSFSMVTFCCVWIAFIPAYLSSQGKTAVAVEIFSILASSAGILACIFTPKVFVILVRPDRNTKKILRRK
ncbi:vomeronasal type-2 receptor 26-like [Paroedura picta]|uniref:vomeronasal type-2 receptor 26-like n=1 Tax=Paroedura picta TaxID=143630 RepID=UPI004055FC62